MLDFVWEYDERIVVTIVSLVSQTSVGTHRTKRQCLNNEKEGNNNCTNELQSFKNTAERDTFVLI